MKPGAGGAEVLSSAARPREELGCATPLEREQKRLLTRAQAQDLLERLADRAELEIQDPARPVELSWTTYLDTDDLRFLASSRSGRARRVRIREYASAATPAGVPVPGTTSFLEVKESAGGRRRKLRHPADRRAIEGILRALERGVVPAGADEVLVEIARVVGGFALRPRVCTLYRRLSLRATSLVRITLDEDVRFYRPPAGDHGVLPPSGALLGAIPGVVVEVKGLGPIPRWLSDPLCATEPLPDFSKFRLGFELALQPCPGAHLDASPRETPLVVPPALVRRHVRRLP